MQRDTGLEEVCSSEDFKTEMMQERLDIAMYKFLLYIKLL